LVRGKQQVFVATNVLGLGIDIPHIRVVIHMGVRSRITDYAQESGRAGRDGQKSEAIILRGCWSRSNGERVKENGWNADKGMQQLIGGGKCRRVVLDEQMDGRVDRIVCEAGEEKCDICQGSLRGVKRNRESMGDAGRELGRVRWMEEGSGVEAEREKRREEIRREAERMEAERMEAEKMEVEKMEAERMEAEMMFEEEEQRHGVIRAERMRERAEIERSRTEEIKEVFQDWTDRCVICKAEGREGQEASSSKWMGCRVEHRNREGFEQTWRALEKVEFERFSGCMKCWAPQEICHSWEAVERGGRKRWKKSERQECQFKGVLRDGMAGILTCSFEGLMGEWVKEEQRKVGFRREEGEDEWMELKRWMGRKVTLGGMEISEMCRMFLVWGRD
jgi:superfamily II DNA helicase RecQ